MVNVCWESSYVTCRPMFHSTPIVHASARPAHTRSLRPASRPSIPHWRCYRRAAFDSAAYCSPHCTERSHLPP